MAVGGGGAGIASRSDILNLRPSVTCLVLHHLIHSSDILVLLRYPQFAPVCHMPSRHCLVLHWLSDGTSRDSRKSHSTEVLYQYCLALRFHLAAPRNPSCCPSNKMSYTTTQNPKYEIQSLEFFGGGSL